MAGGGRFGGRNLIRLENHDVRLNFIGRVGRYRSSCKSLFFFVHDEVEGVPELIACFKLECYPSVLHEFLNKNTRISWHQHTIICT